RRLKNARHKTRLESCLDSERIIYQTSESKQPSSPPRHETPAVRPPARVPVQAGALSATPCRQRFGGGGARRGSSRRYGVGRFGAGDWKDRLAVAESPRKGACSRQAALPLAMGPSRRAGEVGRGSASDPPLARGAAPERGPRTAVR